jgi:hypothetical protein
LSWQHIAAEVLFISAGIIAVWSIVHTIREAWPRIKELLRELDQ